ncbi:MAG: ABC transporter substrate-binding protein [Vibrio sp.]
MKKWLVATVFAAVAFSGVIQAKPWTTLRFGIEGAYPPFSWTAADGSLQGFDVDIAHALCAEMQVECQIVAQDWDGIIPALLARKYDAIIAAMSITEDRKSKVDFTSKYAQIPNRFMAKKGTNLSFSPQGLKGVRIGVQRATTHDKYLTDNYGDVAEIVRYGASEQAYRDLASGRIVALLGDASVLEAVLHKVAGDGYEFVGPVLTDARWFGEGFGIAVRKQDKDLTQQLNAAIKALRDKGIYQQIQAKYFTYDIYGE